MRLLDCFIVVIVYMFLSGTYIIFRSRSLKRGYSSSDKNNFLEFFEQDFLGKTKPTWRWRYSFVYNSKIYFILCNIACICCYLVVLIGIVTLILLHRYGYWQVLL